MKILFINLSGLRFTVATPDTAPLGGTESAICYLARQLTQNGHRVSLVAHRPEDFIDEMVMGVRHVLPATLLTPEFLSAENYDVIVVSNAALAGPSLRMMSPRSLILLWDHLAPDHPTVKELAEPLVRDSFDAFVYVSEWQRQITQTHFAMQKASAVIGNGFAPAFENMFTSAHDLLAAKENRAAYTTTPFRGLSVLVDAIHDLGTGTKFDIYSSMKVYQTTTDDQYAALYRYAAQNPDVTLHGAAPQPELAQRLRRVSFFTYPSTYAETFCIAGLEAVAAGMKVLTTATAALPEVFGGNGDYVALSQGNTGKLIYDYRQMLEKNVALFLAQPETWAEERFAALEKVNRTCSWAARARVWEIMLESAQQEKLSA